MPGGPPGTASSGTSTRTRRDEVWELKRQRFLAKRNGGASSDPGGRRPPPIQSGSQATYAAPSGAPNSPLSQLLANGYPGTSEAGGNFDRNVAQQWNANVQDVQHQRQQRADPNFSGPARAQGGQRVTQNPGGRSNIDLGWDPQPQSHFQNNQGPSHGNLRASPSPHGAYQYQTPYGRDVPNGPSQRIPSGRGPSGQQQYGAPGQQLQYGAPAAGAMPSQHGHGGMPPQRQPSPARQAPAPQYSGAAGSGMPMQNYGNYAAGAAGSRTNANGPVPQGGRQGARPPGGASQIVFG